MGISLQKQEAKFSKTSIEYNSKDYKCLTRINGFIHKNNPSLLTLIISDCDSNKINLLNINEINNKNNSNNDLHGLIDYNFKCPWAICVYMKKEQIFISDFNAFDNKSRIIIFDSSNNFNYLKEFESDNYLKLIECLFIDENEEKLYASDYSNDLITIWNCNDDKYLNKIEVNSPSDCAINGNYLYVVSSEKLQSLETINTTTTNNKDTNCIYVFNKHTYLLINKIRLDNWISPACILFDTVNNYLLTLALEFNSSSSSSQHVTFTRYLYYFDIINYSFIKKVSINIDRVSDAYLWKNSLFILRGPHYPPLCVIDI